MAKQLFRDEMFGFGEITLVSGENQPILSRVLTFLAQRAPTEGLSRRLAGLFCSKVDLSGDLEVLRQFA